MKNIILLLSFWVFCASAHATENLYLFSKPSCPFCVKVERYLQTQHKTVEIKNVSKDPAALQELISKGGKRQVPCLFHDGVYLYESNDIIQWMRQHPDLLTNAN